MDCLLLSEIILIAILTPQVIKITILNPRLGSQIVVISAGNGFYSSHVALCKSAQNRAQEIGVGIDLVCLTKPPHHLVPLVQRLSDTPASESSREATKGKEFNFPLESTPQNSNQNDSGFLSVELSLLNHVIKNRSSAPSYMIADWYLLP